MYRHEAIQLVTAVRLANTMVGAHAPIEPWIVDAVLRAANRDIGRAASSVINERLRQRLVEGYSPESDDKYKDGELAAAAAAYTIYSAVHQLGGQEAEDIEEEVRVLWPFGAENFKPKNQHDDLVRAGALILAELERIERAAAQ